MRKINIPAMVIAILIPLLIGMISAALSSDGMEAYGIMTKPPLSPPAFIFPVAWTALYIMMGLASYFAFMADATPKNKLSAFAFYGAQLFFNFAWSIIFFRWEAYFAAFIWLLSLWLLVIICAVKFYSVSHMATYLLIPYIAWLTFAAYLNMGAYVLNNNVN